MARAEEGNNSRLVAPRRFGKTSLLRRVMYDADKAGWATVYVDFFGVLRRIDQQIGIDGCHNGFVGFSVVFRPEPKVGSN